MVITHNDLETRIWPYRNTKSSISHGDDFISIITSPAFSSFAQPHLCAAFGSGPYRAPISKAQWAELNAAMQEAFAICDRLRDEHEKRII